MFTKKHYEAIAKIINKHYPQQITNEYHAMVSHIVVDITSDLATFFGKDNPRFNAKRFASACFKKS